MKRILTVDDSSSMRKMVRFTLESAGYEVIEHENGLLALEWAHENVADLVISDINMPIMDGYTLVKSLRALPAYQLIPILILTTESSAESKIKGKDVGATDWIVKPFDPNKILDAISKILNN